MSGHTSLILLVLVSFFHLPYLSATVVSVLSPPVHSASPSQPLDDWCSNLTKHLNTTLEKFGSVTFNRSTGLLYMASSNVTELERLVYDLHHIKIYSLLFGQIPSFIISQQSALCLQESMRQMGGLIAGLRMAELYLNGTIPSPPNFLHGTHGTMGNLTRYQDLGGEMAALKGLMRKLVIILGNTAVNSAHILSK